MHIPGGGIDVESVETTHPGGTGPMRVKAMVPELPALLPPVKLNCNEAVLQLPNVTVPLPTGVDPGSGLVTWSNRPPVVS